MGKILHGHLERDTVIVSDEAEASSLFNRSGTGYMVKGRLFFTPVEAFYLMNEGKLELNISKKEFLEKAMSTPDFQTRYMVYRELRKRGFLIRDDGFMYIRRGGEQKERGEMMVFPLDEKDIFDFEGIYGMAGENRKKTHTEEKEGTGTEAPDVQVLNIYEKKLSGAILRAEGPLIFAIVDGDGDVTYYSIDRYEPHGPHTSEPSRKGNALLIEDMGIMLEGYEEVNSLFYGKKTDEALYLSTIECLYLIGRKKLSLYEGKKRVSFDSLMKRASDKDPEIETKLSIYSDLRERGLIVRTGFKYGTHFRVYVKDVEQHAKYLAHAIPERYRGSWPEISRGVRLAHGVKKEFLLAEASKNPRYLRIRRVRL